MFFPQKTPPSRLLRFLKSGDALACAGSTAVCGRQAPSTTPESERPPAFGRLGSLSRCAALLSTFLALAPLPFALHGAPPSPPANPPNTPKPKPATEPAPAGRAPDQPAKADDTDSPEKTYQKALQAFAGEKFPECITLLQTMIDQGAKGPEAESIYYTLAAAHYNSQDFPKAKSAFEQYLKLYPSGSKALDCRISLSHCLVQLGDKEAALAIFSDLAKQPELLSERVLLSWTTLLKDTGDLQYVLTLLRPRGNVPLQTEESVQLLFQLASVEAEIGNPDGSFRYLQIIHSRTDLVGNPLQLNAISFSLGDAFLKKRAFKLALRAYAFVRRKDEIIALQQSRLQSMQARYQANLMLLAENPGRLAEIQDANLRLKARFEEGQKVVAQVEKTEDYLPPLRLRQARASQELARHWEAVVLLESLLTANPDNSIREEVLFGLSLSHAHLNHAAESENFSSAYLKEYPNGKNAEILCFVQGTLKLQREEYAAAEVLFQKAVLDFPEGTQREQSLFLLGNARFSSGKYPEAQEAYQQHLEKYPASELKPEVEYRSALCQFFKGEKENALHSLRAFLEKYPEGPFSSDSSYRIALSHQGLRQYQEVIAQCDAWQQAFGKQSQLAEVLALKADALAALGQHAEAAEAYQEAMTSSPSEDVLNYALFEANKQYQKLSRWDKTSELFQKFIQEHPEHPGVVAAMYWLSRAMQKSGQLAEAKEFLAAKIANYVGDRKSEAVEQLISQLAQLSIKPPPGTVSQAASEQTKNERGGKSSTAPKASPEAPRGHVPEAELERLFPENSVSNNGLGRARYLFAKAELHRLTRKPSEAAALLGKIAQETPPTELSASLLARCGEHQLAGGQIESAQSFYNELLIAFPKSPMLDAAYNGMGQVALLENRPEDALRWFEDALTKLGAPTTQREVTLGKGKALLALKHWDQARTLFQQVATTREWRGEATAEAVYLLGEVHFQNGEFESGLQYFQRVFVAYQRYPAQVGRAYLRAADSFERIGDLAKAQSHLRELIANERLSNLPSAAEAKRRLATLSEK